ncbi:MAG: hypothetical protein HFJ17_06010 [Clostridia bacterium]|nr:hypothetical protein [Clostridia bacterium]
MRVKRKILITIIIINILITLLLSIIPIISLAAVRVNQQLSDRIDLIDDSKYPGIKQKIQELQIRHPNWKFKVLYTGLKWEDVIKGETSSHGTNVVSKNIYGADWICSICGKNKTYSGGSWYCASENAVRYMMDARNSLNDSDVFQFLELSYNTSVQYDSSAVKAILTRTFLDDGNLDKYVAKIMDSCKNYKVNPYYIAAKMIQEQGTKGGSTYKMLGSSGNGKFIINDQRKTLTVLTGTKVKNITEYLGKEYTIKNRDGKNVTDKDAAVATGYKVDNGYTIAVLGDVNGDGKIKATDYMRIKNHILGKSKLSDAEKVAADVNNDGNVRATDYMKIKNYILKKSSISIPGEEYYYNIFNIGATGRTTADVINNALNKAKAQEWTTVEKCIDGGVKFIAEGYIDIGQDSMYLEKFNVVNTTKGHSYYTHQYAQDLLYAQNQGTKLKGILSNINAIDYAYTFVIPVYEEMPIIPCARPVSQ